MRSYLLFIMFLTVSLILFFGIAFKRISLVASVILDLGPALGLITSFIYLLKADSANNLLLMRSMPVSLKKVMANYYITAWAIFLGVSLISMIIVGFYSMFFSRSYQEMANSTGQSYAYYFYKIIFYFTVNVVFSFPILIVKGAKSANLFILYIVNLVIWQFWGSASIFLNLNQNLVNIPNGFADYAVKFLVTNGFFLSSIFWAFVLIVINYISYKVSILLYNKVQKAGK